MADTVTQQTFLKHPRSFFIGGKWVEPATSRTFDVYDSVSEEVFLTVSEGLQPDMERAVAAARQAFDTGPWPRMSPQERASYLVKIAEGWEQRADTLADSWTMEAGVVRTIASSASMAVAGAFRQYASFANSFGWEDPRTGMMGNPALLVYEPVGVVVAIIPWNASSTLLTYKVAPALLAGCPVILKASPEAPIAPYLLAEIAEEVGLPPGVLNVVTADREASELLVRDPRVDKVSFTGSTAAGQLIGSICGSRVARCTLELGGKSPAVVLSDYDVGLVAKVLGRCAPIMTGQVCASLTRVIIDRARHDDMVEALAAEFKAIKIGNPFDPEVQMGPLAMKRQLERVSHYIDVGQREGAKLAAGGARPAHLPKGYFIEPTLFGQVDNRSTIAQEEIFGPVLCVIPADNDDHAVELANDTVYGLNASVFTNDVDRAYTVGRRIRAGTVGHNAFRTDFTIAFGGFKQSGIGREGGVNGLLPYLESKTMVFDGAPPSGASKS